MRYAKRKANEMTPARQVNNYANFWACLHTQKAAVTVIMNGYSSANYWPAKSNVCIFWNDQPSILK
jgi:hypothetical protein